MIEAIRAAVKSMIKPDLVIGKVKSFQESDWTITVELNQGATVDDVSIRSVINSETTGILVEPKVGSYVVCGLTDGKIENLTVLVFSEIKNMKLVPAEKLILRSDDFGGLVKLQQLEANLDTLKTAIENLITFTQSGLNAVGVGSAANGPGAATAFQSMTEAIQIQFQDMENKNVNHG